MSKPTTAPRLPRSRKWHRATVAEWRRVWSSGALTSDQYDAAIRMITNIDILNNLPDSDLKERRMLSDVIRLERNSLIRKPTGAQITKAERAAKFPTEEEWRIKSREWQDALPQHVKDDMRGHCWTRAEWRREFGASSRYPMEIYADGTAWTYVQPAYMATLYE